MGYELMDALRALPFVLVIGGAIVAVVVVVRYFAVTGG